MLAVSFPAVGASSGGSVGDLSRLSAIMASMEENLVAIVLIGRSILRIQVQRRALRIQREGMASSGNPSGGNGKILVDPETEVAFSAALVFD